MATRALRTPVRDRLFFVLGPCVIESSDHTLRIAERLQAMAERERVDVVFKSSYDKANRSSIEAYRGPGLEEGLRVLERVRDATSMPILVDVHTAEQAAAVADVADVVQIPAFLCRQTDLLVAAGRTGLPVHIKKGQFVAPSQMRFVAEKAIAGGSRDIWLGERGTSFGYGDLVADMRSLVVLRDLADEIDGRVVFDATHAVQRPGGETGEVSGGDRRFVPALARAAVAVGVDGVFAEVHPDPPHALSDAASQWPLDLTEQLVVTLMKLDEARREAAELYEGLCDEPPT